MKSLSPVFLRQSSAFCVLAALLAVAGCKRDDVKVYQVAKEDSTPAPSPQLQFALPPGWQQAAPGQMRAASFTVTGASGQTADVGVIPLPAGENELDILNMWRDQVQLPPATNVDSQPISVGNDSAKLFDVAGITPLAGEKFPKRILVAELTKGATSWFFKMTGAAPFIAEQKETFLQFLKSVSFVEASAPPMMAAATPSSAQAINPAVYSIWTIPENWQTVAPSSEMLFAEFALTNASGAKAGVNVAALAGTGGGLEGNVTRWRGQLGLPPIAEIISSSFDVTGGKAQLVDYSGTNAKTGQPARLIGVIVPQAGQTWFYKLMGDDQVVAAQREAFIKFIQSAKYPDAH
ncbi:MAG TPA: hypothetical protein VGO57_12065 [Verrucomicrobiae bacterium]